MVPCASPVAPCFFLLLNLLWARVVGTLRGPSLRALRRIMVPWAVESVALATFLTSKLILSIGQLVQSKQVAATALRLTCGLGRDPSSLRAPRGALRLL
eukprot:SAG11_NODE_1836_length_4187_cov_69.990460_5_plen_99_part_00